MEQFFFSKFETRHWNGVIKKKKERTHTVARRCSIKTVFLEILQNLLKSNCARLPPASNLIKKDAVARLLSCEFCEISKYTFYYRTPPMAASVKKERKNVKLAFKLN